METPAPQNSNTSSTAFTVAPSHPALRRIGVPGAMTSEFWIAIILIALQIAGAISGLLTPNAAAIMATITGAIYKALRTWLKIAALDITPDTLANLAALPEPTALPNSTQIHIEGSAPGSAQTQNPAAPIGGAAGSAASLAAIIGTPVILIGFLFSGCASSQVQADTQKVAAYVAKPTTQAALGDVFNTAVDAASGQDYNAAVNGIKAGALLVRGLQSTPSAANPSAISSAVTTGGASTALASKVSTAVTTLVQSGASADAANEQVAQQLDAAVAQLTTGAPGPKGPRGKRFADHARWLRERALSQIDRDDYKAFLRDEKAIAEITRIGTQGMTRLEVQTSRRDDAIIRENQRIRSERKLPVIWFRWTNTPIAVPVPTVCFATKN